jgi:ABC-type branched-subunit amino acid transport system ATPase component
MNSIHNNPDGVETVPLRAWLEEEIKKEQPAAQKNNNDIESLSSSQLFILRKTTVAYAVAELLRRAIAAAPLSADKISLDNFAVRTKKKDDESASFSTSPSTADILGVDMISEMLSLTIIEPSYMNHLFDEGGEEVGPGRYLEVCISPSKPPQTNNASAVEPSHERTVCHLFGILLYQLYSNLDPFPMSNLLGVQPMKQDINTLLGDDDNGDTREPVHKKAATSDAPFSSSSTTASTCKKLTYSALHDLGSSPSIIRLVQNLVESKSDHPMNPQNICSSMREACNDLHLLLHEPDRFLFTRNQFERGNAQLQLRKNKLYGREKEVSAISGSFHRVCTGNSEAFFIGGFSGSGKTRLVESVIQLVEIVGGYVLIHKFDQMSAGRPLLELISAFDNLCLLVQRKNSPQELEVIVNKLTESFGSDLSLLGRLLPNVYSLLPHLEQSKQVRRGDNQMNFQSVCFILRQFIKIVSSKSHPVMLFLDDLQVSSCFVY